MSRLVRRQLAESRRQSLPTASCLLPTETAVSVALARATIYRWLSRAFVKPNDPACSPQTLREALDALSLGGFQTLADVTQEQLAAEFPRLFSHNLTPDCPPYETQYGSTHIFWQSQQLADIAGFYRAFGLELSGSALERVDHLAVELEFMGYLALKEAYALERRNEANVAITEDTQRKFLKDHLGKWVGAFRGRLQIKLPGSAYANLAEVLVRLVEWDCQRIGIQPELLRFDATAQAEGPIDGGCLPCGGSGGPACA